MITYFNAQLIQEPIILCQKKNSKIVFTQTIPEFIDKIHPSNKLFLLNTEQLTVALNKSFHINLQNEFKKANENNITIIDYSFVNSYLFNKLLNYKIPFVLEPFYPNISIPAKTIEISALLNNKYRKRFARKFINFPINNLNKTWGNKRLNIKLQSKVLINIHAEDDYRVAELMRLYEAVACRCIVISQLGVQDKINTLSPYIIFVNKNNMNAKVKDVLENYQNYYNKIYGNKTNEEIFKPISEQYLRFIKS
jgi:hypothetical protein